MPKKIKNCFYEKLTFEKMLAAHQRAKKFKTNRKEVIEFELNLENNIVNLLNSIKNNKYSLGKYYSFVIYEPKKRIINALPYKDRIVHQWYVEEFIKPNIVPKLINTTYACFTDRGTHKATRQVQKFMQIFKRNYGDFWVLKFDISKFFYSIDPNILFNIMKKYITDKKLLEFTHLLIYSGQAKLGDVGIPIGNYTSQFFANIYLNELDQYVKRVLKIPYYVRYMDDFIILVKTKNDAIRVTKLVSEFLDKNLHLKLNSKSRYYPYKMGVNFCGYRIFTTHSLLRDNSKRKIKKNIKIWNLLHSYKVLDVPYTKLRLNSWLGHASHCNSYHLQMDVIGKCDFIYNEKIPPIKIINELLELMDLESMKRTISK